MRVVNLNGKEQEFYVTAATFEHPQAEGSGEFRSASSQTFLAFPLAAPEEAAQMRRPHGRCDRLIGDSKRRLSFCLRAEPNG